MANSNSLTGTGGPGRLNLATIVFDARIFPMAGRNARVHSRRTISALLLSTLVATASFTAVSVPRPAAADQVADLQAQATAISQQLVEAQLQAEAYQQQYSVVSARVSAEARTVAQIGAQITQVQQLISARDGEVRRQAIRSYMNYGTGTASSSAVLFGGSQETAQAASEYSSIAVGNITTAVDLLRTAQDTLQAHQATLRQQEAADQSDEARQADVLGQADSSTTHLESLHAQVTGQLAAAVAAQAAAAAAAVAAAQRVAARASANRAPANRAPATTEAPAPTAPGSTEGGTPVTTTTTGAAASGGGGGGGTDPELNSFLQCVVQAESGGDYGVVSPNGLYMGAFQFSQSTWDIAAQAAGRPDLVGVPPNVASKADQDAVAVALFALDGGRPWLGDRCST